MKHFSTPPCNSINVKGRLMTFEVPKVMGILNVTQDSFYEGGRHPDKDNALKRVTDMIAEGVDIIDIGAMSTRPGAQMITPQEEMDKLMSIVHVLVQEFPEQIFSIDTFRADIAREAINSGAHIINDVSGGSLDKNMFATVAELNVPYILMHMRGTPETMNRYSQYNDIVNDIAVELGRKVSTLRSLGVKDIILDPGFGFAKTIDQNLELLLRIDQLHYFELPILGGISRKSTIYKKLGITPSEALNGTTALNTLMLERGVQILRVHDVREAKQLVKLFFT